MERKRWRICGKCAVAAVLAFSMVAQPMVDLGKTTTTSVAASTLVENSDFINLEQSATELYVGTDWSGAAATYTEMGSSVTIDTSSYGWNGEWGLQYIVKELGLNDDGKYEITFDITSSIAKKVFVKLDDAGFIVDTLELAAGETYHYSKSVECGTFKDQKLYFALGQMAGEEVNLAGTMTISDICIREIGGGVIQDPSTGKEYDFSAIEENAANDYADPGTTKDGYDLIWADEFDGNYGDAEVDSATGLNLNNWAYQFGDGTTDCSNPGWGNNELQCYTGDVDNIGVNEDLNGDGSGNGLLRITAKYEADGYQYADESSKKYTSARIRTTSPTEELFDTTYGYVEARISLPETKGAWPAFWMLPESTNIYGSWPVSGEIDIMETTGTQSNMVCGTLHWGAPEHVYKGSGYVSLDSEITYFHTYAIDWQPGQITWYYDGKAINTLSNWESGFSGASDKLSFDAPFDQPFYMLLNLAVDSGQFGGSANKASFDDKINMYVDYVRVYQKTEGYADSVERVASSDGKTDWADYAGQNQIAEIKADNIVADVVDGNVNALESNGTSDAGKWYLAYQADASDATAEAYTDDAAKTWAKVGVHTKGSQDYSVQLIGHYNAKAGYVYKVSFDAYADGNMVGKTVNCDSKEWKGWSTYGIMSFELKNTATSYSYLISQTEDFDDCRIEFNLGAKDSGNVYISNVKVEIVDPESIGQEATERTALADGNLIYNGTFDQGSKHFGYWSATDGTTVKIPRYTTEKLADGDVSVVDVASMSNYEKLADGVKYYERRAQISASADVVPAIYQTDLKMPADSYTLNFDLYSAKDTAVTAAIYTVTEAGTLGEELFAGTGSYKVGEGVKNYSWIFDTDQDIENAALVLSFGQGASVQVDNVSMIGKSLGQKVDETPVNDKTSWSVDKQSGNYSDAGLELENGIYTLSDVTSGTVWYAPQVISNDFSLVTGNQYKLSFQFKLEGNSNQTVQYIIQENGGSWTVYNNGPTTITYEADSADTDGFCNYEVVFTAGTTLNNVHMVFGLGNSGATGDCKFSFKNVNMSLVKASEGGEGGATGTMLATSYPITYVLNGGTNAVANPVRYIKGEGIAEFLAPTRSGYEFLGWTIGSEGKNYVKGIAKDQTGAITLVANWSKVDAQIPSMPENPSVPETPSTPQKPSAPENNNSTNNAVQETVTVNNQAQEIYSQGDKTYRKLSRKDKAGYELIGETALLPDGTQFKVDECTKDSASYRAAAAAVQKAWKNAGKFAVYDINLLDSRGMEIHEVGGYVSVTLPVPAEFASSRHLTVYRLEEDGTLTKCETTVKDGKVTFLTNHFSTYVLMESSVKSAQTSDNGMAHVAQATLLLMAGIMMFCVVYRKKRYSNMR